MKRLLSLACMLLVGSLVAGCAEPEPTPTPTVAAIATPTAASEPTATTPPTATPEPTATATPIPSPTPPSPMTLMEQGIAAYEELSSVRATSAITMTFRGEGLVMEMPITMAMAYEAPDLVESLITMAFMGEAFEMETIIVGDDLYTRQTPETVWDFVPGGAAMGGAGGDPSQFLAFDLDVFEDLTFVGIESLEDVETYHIQGQLPFETLMASLALAGDLPIFDGNPLLAADYWLGLEDELVHRAAVHGQFASEELGPGMTMEIAMDARYFDFNAPVDISVPAADEIRDLADMDMGSPGGVEAFALAFSPDGGWLATGMANNEVWLWDASDLTEPVQVLAGHTDRVRAVAFDPDSGVLASAGEDNTILLWALDSLQEGPFPLTGHADWIRALAFSPDGERLASAGDDRQVLLWTDSDEAATPLLGHSDWVRALAFSPDGALLASAGDDQTILLWDLSDLAAEPTVLAAHERWIEALAFSPDGALLASGDDEGTLILWRMPAAEVDQILDTGLYVDIGSLAFSPDGEQLAAAVSGGRLLVWDTGDLAAPPQELARPGNWPNALAFSPDGAMLVSVWDDGALVIHDANDYTAPAIEVFAGVP